MRLHGCNQFVDEAKFLISFAAKISHFCLGRSALILSAAGCLGSFFLALLLTFEPGLVQQKLLLTEKRMLIGRITDTLHKSTEAMLESLVVKEEKAGSVGIRFLVASDPRILAAYVWDGEGARVYPPLSGSSHFLNPVGLLALRPAAELRDQAVNAAANSDSPKVLFRTLDPMSELILSCARPTGVYRYCLLLNGNLLLADIEQILGAESGTRLVRGYELNRDNLVVLPGFEFLQIEFSEAPNSGYLWILWLFSGTCLLLLVLNWILNRHSAVGPDFQLISEAGQEDRADILNEGSCFYLNKLRIEIDTQMACHGEQRLELSTRDIRILQYLAEHPGQVVSKDQMYNVGWGREYMPNSRALEQYISTLRRKLAAFQTADVNIETVRGSGYRFTPK